MSNWYFFFIFLYLHYLGQTLLYSSALPIVNIEKLKSADRRLPLNNLCGSYKLDLQHIKETIFISAYETNISIADVIWDAEVIIETLLRCEFDYIKTVHHLCKKTAMSPGWKYKLMTKDQVKHFIFKTTK